MTIRTTHFLIMISLLVLIAAIAFIGRFRDRSDRFDEMDTALSGIRHHLSPATLISVYSLIQEGEVPGYAANALAPVPVLAHSLLTDTVIFIRDPGASDSVWRHYAADRIVLDSAHSEHFGIYLTRRRT